MVDKLKETLNQSEQLNGLLEKGGAESSSATDLTAERERLGDLLDRLNKAAQILQAENSILEEPINAPDLRNKLKLLLAHKSSLPDLTAFNQSLSELDATFRCNDFLRSALDARPSARGGLRQAIAPRALS